MYTSWPEKTDVLKGSQIIHLCPTGTTIIEQRRWPTTLLITTCNAVLQWSQADPVKGRCGWRFSFHVLSSLLGRLRSDSPSNPHEGRLGPQPTSGPNDSELRAHTCPYNNYTPKLKSVTPLQLVRTEEASWVRGETSSRNWNKSSCLWYSTCGWVVRCGLRFQTHHYYMTRSQYKSCWRDYNPLCIWCKLFQGHCSSDSFPHTWRDEKTKKQNKKKQHKKRKRAALGDSSSKIIITFTIYWDKIIWHGSFCLCTRKCQHKSNVTDQPRLTFYSRLYNFKWETSHRLTGWLADLILEYLRAGSEEKHFHVMQGWTRAICQTESLTCDTSYEGLLLPLQSSSQEYMSAHTSTPAAGGPQHTGYTPPYLALGSHHETQWHAGWKPPRHFTTHYQKHTIIFKKDQNILTSMPECFQLCLLNQIEDSNPHLTYSWEVLLLLLLCWNCIYQTNTLTCTRPTRGMAWAARHLFQIEEGSGGAFRNACDPSQTIINTPQLNYKT